MTNLTDDFNCKFTNEELMERSKRKLLILFDLYTDMLLEISKHGLTNSRVMRTANQMALNLGRFRRHYNELCRELAPVDADILQKAQELLAKKQAKETAKNEVRPQAVQAELPQTRHPELVSGSHEVKNQTGQKHKKHWNDSWRKKNRAVPADIVTKGIEPKFDEKAEKELMEKLGIDLKNLETVDLKALEKDLHKKLQQVW